MAKKGEIGCGHFFSYGSMCLESFPHQSSFLLEKQPWILEISSRDSKKELAFTSLTHRGDKPTEVVRVGKLF